MRSVVFKLGLLLLGVASVLGIVSCSSPYEREVGVGGVGWGREREREREEAYLVRSRAHHRTVHRLDSARRRVDVGLES